MERSPVLPHLREIRQKIDHSISFPSSFCTTPVKKLTHPCLIVPIYVWHTINSQHHFLLNFQNIKYCQLRPTISCERHKYVHLVKKRLMHHYLHTINVNNDRLRKRSHQHDNMSMLLRLSVIRYNRYRYPVPRKRLRRKNFHELYLLFHPQKVQ